jgi:ABC-type branched-subunit amino acid transport system permease subunit
VAFGWVGWRWVERGVRRLKVWLRVCCVVAVAVAVVDSCVGVHWRGGREKELVIAFCGRQ